MPPFKAVKAANAINAAIKPRSRPVALFVGGSSGIGKAAAEAFARYTNGDAHIIISGRNERAVKSIISSFPTSSSSQYEFLPCDATLMSNISKSCASLSSRPDPITKINYLFLSPGILTFSGRDDTTEGLDKKFALNFHARWKFVMELMPLLQAAKDAGEEVRVVTIVSFSRSGGVNFDDPGLKKTFSISTVQAAPPLYNDLMVEEFAARYPGISFISAYPGGVRTPMITAHWFLYIMYPFVYPLTVSEATCGEYMAYVLLHPTFAKGAFHVNSSDNEVAPKHITPEARKRIYEYLVESVDVK